jgi:hypothetical protein
MLLSILLSIMVHQIVIKRYGKWVRKRFRVSAYRGQRRRKRKPKPIEESKGEVQLMTSWSSTWSNGGDEE